MTFIRNVAAKVGVWESRKDGRVSGQALDASYRTGPRENRANIKDISPVGVYLQTDDHWLVGTSVVLTLQEKDLPGRSPRVAVRLKARAVRLGEDGVGLAFAHEPMDTTAWVKLMTKAAAISAHKDVIHVFRITKALAFLARVCPAAENLALKLLTEEMSSARAEKTIETILKADELLMSQDRATRSDVHPNLVLRILVYASKVHDEEMLQCWAGLLATSSLADSKDSEMLDFVDLLSKLYSIHIRILTASAARAMTVGWETGFVFSRGLFCTADEIKKIAAGRNLATIEQDLHCLHDLGLLEQTIKKVLLEPITEANITPTKLGLRFYAACSGQMALPEAHMRTRLEIAS